MKHMETFMSAEALLAILVIGLIVIYLLVQFILKYRSGTLHIDLDDT
jgi:ABC-type protease/lipase transport system fused ATPase/permease subunit